MKKSINFILLALFGLFYGQMVVSQNSNYLITTDLDTIRYINLVEKAPYPDERGLKYIKYGEVQKKAFDEIHSYYINNNLYEPLTVAKDNRRIFAHRIIQGSVVLYATRDKKGTNLYFQQDTGDLVKVPKNKVKSFFKEQISDFPEFEEHIKNYYGSKGINWTHNDYLLGRTLTYYNAYKNPELNVPFKPRQYQKSNFYIVGAAYLERSSLQVLGIEFENDSPIFNGLGGIDFRRQFNIYSAIVTGLRIKTFPLNFYNDSTVGEFGVSSQPPYFEIPVLYQHNILVNAQSRVYLSGGFTLKSPLESELRSYTRNFDDIAYKLSSVWVGVQAGLGYAHRIGRSREIIVELGYDLINLNKVSRRDFIGTVELEDSFFKSNGIFLAVKIALF